MWRTQVSCLEAFAAVVTPRATLSTPRIDLGTTFLGVPVKQVWWAIVTCNHGVQASFAGIIHDLGTTFLGVTVKQV